MNDTGAGEAELGEGGEAVTSRDLAVQIVFVCLSWLFLCALHWSNDGLWFQGDSPRHMANGLFWKDYLRSLDPDPVGFAAEYFARYPVINPVSYPPVFYLLEAAAFSVFGPSPYVAKGLVLGFTLVAALYTTAWLRRWVAPESGYLGALVPLLPDVARFSHAVMLNVPSLALTVAALYHARRWLEAPGSRQIYPAALLSVLAILCYIPSAVLVFVLVAWMVALGRVRLLWDRRTLIVAATCGLVLLPWALIVIRWSRGHVEMTTPTSRTIAQLSSWMYYLDAYRSIFGGTLTVLAGTGAVAGILSRRWRRETALLLIWIGVTYLALTYLKAKDPRYLLPLATPLTCLAAIAIFAPARAVQVRLPHRAVTLLASAAMMAVLAAQAWQAWRIPVPAVSGFPELIAFFDQVAPGEAIFYDGRLAGVFTFYVRAGDPDFRRRVVRGDKLLYVIPLNGAMRSREFVASRQDVIEALQRRSGCRWLAIDEGIGPLPAASLLREVVRGPEFEWVRSFPIHMGGVMRLDVYRMLIPVAAPEAIDLPMDMLGPGARLETRAIDRRRIRREPDQSQRLPQRAGARPIPPR